MVLQCIHDLIVKYVCASPEGDMSRELCLHRDKDDFI